MLDFSFLLKLMFCCTRHLFWKVEKLKRSEMILKDRWSLSGCSHRLGRCISALSDITKGLSPPMFSTVGDAKEVKCGLF